MNVPAALDPLDLLLAMRPEDLSEDEATAIESIPEVERAALEADDAFLAEMISGWSVVSMQPSFTGADILARAANDVPPQNSAARDDFPRSSGLAERPTQPGAEAEGPFAGSPLPSWVVPMALAASIAAAVFGGWRLMTPPERSPEMRPKALVGEQQSSRVALQFSVERGDEVLPGRNGGAYGANDSLAFRFDLAGEPGFVSLLEVGPDGQWKVLYPIDGGMLALDAGVHVLSDDKGAPLVYRPDTVVAGTLDYIAVVLSEPVDPGRVMPGLLAAGLHRADLWPRPVVAVDAVSVTWE